MDIDDNPSAKPFTESKDGLAGPLTDSARAGQDWASIATSASGPLEGELQAGFLPALPLEAPTFSATAAASSSPVEAEEATAGSITEAAEEEVAAAVIGSGWRILFRGAGCGALAVAPLDEEVEEEEESALEAAAIGVGG